MSSFQLVAPARRTKASPALADMTLRKIERLDRELMKSFEASFIHTAAFNRTLVSFQANKERPIYRWYKFKEGFSASLVEYPVNFHKIKNNVRSY
jgi:hypothetical protein